MRVHPSAQAKPCWAGGADAENAIPARQIPALPLLEAGEEEEQRGGQRFPVFAWHEICVYPRMSLLPDLTISTAKIVSVRCQQDLHE